MRLLAPQRNGCTRYALGSFLFRVAMMEGVYRKVYIRVWYDEDFRALSPDGKLLFFYMVVNPHGNLAGIFVLPMGYAQEDMNWDIDRLMTAWRQIEDRGMIIYEPKTKILLVRNFLKYNPFENQNTVISAVKHVSALPESSLKERWCAIAQEDLRGKQQQFVPPFIQEFEETLKKRSSKRSEEPSGEAGAGAGTGEEGKPSAVAPKEKVAPADKGNGQELFKPEKIWPEKLSGVPMALERLGFKGTDLEDPEYWTKQLEWIDGTGFEIYVLDEFKGYVAHQAGLPKAARHKNNRRGFRNWLATAVRWRQRDASRSSYRPR